ncbi:ATP-binding cassette domain-containing protein [Methanoplanus endosymbiosus]|uniref:Molybdate/tungstate import ATP-binding protein WtpC n=1 Tax=Methanoplanus endosymbiosus TaxID=33865 RepID=A0A9E7PQC6_9EURY|nr:ATP-binding cassette domain-containing protein [Methanoplanus endosymbiosus]UUX91597.1 ATP-binding cassette domain-containing protein [Methanoplanus endosymbiosus]
MLKLDNISKNLGEFRIDNASLDVIKGEYMVIIGPTGAGKTILLETVAGIYPPDSGRVIMGGRDITDAQPKDRNIAMVYQDFVLFPHLTVEANIGFGLKSRKVPRPEIEKKVRDIASVMGIDHLLHRYPGTLSGGEKQRTAICRAILMEPDILLLDEPLSALDTQTRENLRGELKKLHKMFNTTFIHITHNYEEVFSLADRVVIMNEGNILQIGDPDEVFRKPKTEFIASFVGFENIYPCKWLRSGKCLNLSIDNVDLVSESYDSSIAGDRATAVLRMEDVIVTPTVPAGDESCNKLKGIIDEIRDSGGFVRITIDAGIRIKAVMMKRDFLRMNLSVGDTAYAVFPFEAFHVIPCGEEGMNPELKE